MEYLCPTDKTGCKYYPDCDLTGLQETKHHKRPRRLMRLAQTAMMDNDYLRDLKKLINHPSNIEILPRCWHDLKDAVTSSELPSRERLSRELAKAVGGVGIDKYDTDGERNRYHYPDGSPLGGAHDGE